jgi:hypothetical protein
LREKREKREKREREREKKKRERKKEGEREVRLLLPPKRCAKMMSRHDGRGSLRSFRCAKDRAKAPSLRS